MKIYRIVSSVFTQEILIFFVIVFCSDAFLNSVHSNPLGSWFNGAVRLGARYDQFNESDLKQVVGTFSIRRTYAFFSVESPFNELSFLSSEGGARFMPGGSSEFKGRAKFIDINFFHEYLLVNISLLDFNKSGFLEEEIIWGGGKIGFAFLMGNEQTNLLMKILGSAGTGRHVFGNIHYNDLGNYNQIRFSGLEAGYLGGLLLNFGKKYIIQGNFFNKTIIVDPEPNVTTIWGEISYKMAQSKRAMPELYFKYTYQRVRIKERDISQNNNCFSIGARITLD
jgi:hypothetical protein